MSALDALAPQDAGSPGYVPYTLEDYRKIKEKKKDTGKLGYVETEEKRKEVSARARTRCV